MNDRMLVQYFIVGICGILIGLLVAFYDDCILKRKHKVLSKRTCMVTLFNALLWILLLSRQGLEITFLLFALTASVLLALSIIDIAIFEIPVQFNVIILILGIIGTAIDYKQWVSHVVGMFLVSGIFYLLALATKGKGMGGGDIKLMATVGLLLGWKRILLVMVLGSLLGAIIHSVIMAFSKKEHVLAFGPYLSAASVIAMCWGNQIIDLYLMYFMRTRIG